MAKRGPCRYAADTMDVFTLRASLALLVLIAPLSLAGCPKDKGKTGTKVKALQAAAKLPGKKAPKSAKAPASKPATTKPTTKATGG
jgi:hypothetical protein